MKNSKRLVACSAALVAVLAAGAAHAQTANLTATGSVLGSSTNYSTNSGTSYSTYSPGRQLSDGTSTFWAYCIDPLTGTDFPETYNVITGLDNYFGGTSSAYASQIARSGYSGQGMSNDATTQTAVKNNLIELFSYAYNDSLLNATNAAAFGMAVWEIILQDGTTNGASSGFSATGGQFRTLGTSTSNSSDAVDVRAAAYLSALNNNSWGTGATAGLGTATNWTYTVYFDNQSPVTQSFLRVTTGGSGGNVPVPATLALAGLGLLMVGRARAKAAC